MVEGGATACYATSNDPGNTTLSGYAYLATDADEMAAALTSAVSIITAGSYSFSQSSIQSTRLSEEDYLFEASFEPIDGDSFWIGHLKKYDLEDDGSVGEMLWDAGTLLNARTASTRNILTTRSGSTVTFNSTNVSMSDAGGDFGHGSGIHYRICLGHEYL